MDFSSNQEVRVTRPINSNLVTPPSLYFHHIEWVVLEESLS